MLYYFDIVKFSISFLTPVVILQITSLAWLMQPQEMKVGGLAAAPYVALSGILLSALLALLKFHEIKLSPTLISFSLFALTPAILVSLINHLFWHPASQLKGVLSISISLISIGILHSIYRSAQKIYLNNLTPLWPYFVFRSILISFAAISLAFPSQASRLVFFSANANQAAFIILSIEIFAKLYLFKYLRKNSAVNEALGIEWFADSIFTIGSGILIFLTGSESTLLSILFIFIGTLTICFVRKVRSFFIVSLGCISFLMLILFPIEIMNIIASFDNSNNIIQSSRVNLWGNSLKSLDIFGFISGNGFGAYSGDTSPFQLRDSHNTFIDLLTTFGITGISILCIIFMKKRFRKVRLPSLKFIQNNDNLLKLSFALSLLVISFSHSLLRQPIFLILCYEIFRSDNLALRNSCT